MAADLLEPTTTIVLNTTEHLTGEDRRDLYHLVLELLTNTPLKGRKAELAKKVADANPCS